MSPQERNSLSLRCLSIILRQESGANRRGEATATIFRSVELAKEAVALDPKDGVSWTILGNAYLCQFFMVAQDTVTLKACLSAYKQAWADPIAKGQPDLYYNRGIVSIFFYFISVVYIKMTNPCNFNINYALFLKY